MTTVICHPHFDYIPTATECYQSRATGQFVILSQRGDEIVALPATSDGFRLPLHAEPIAWGSTEWDVLDKVHAQR